MGLRQAVARMLAPGSMDADEVRAIVAREVSRVRAEMAVSNPDYDPKGEGYRRISGLDKLDQERRDLTPISQNWMFELAYYLYDTSGLVKRYCNDTKNFVCGEGISYSVGNDPDGAALEVIDEFWFDSINQIHKRLEKKITFHSLLGEQCWPVVVNPHNGRVHLSYVDPVNIAEVLTVPDFPEIPAEIKLVGASGTRGKSLVAIRECMNPRRPDYGRLVGECFFMSINNPPNGSRGRSDLIHLFDILNGFEEGLFDELDRIKFIKAYIWDVLVEGADDETIRVYEKKYGKPPKPGTVRFHNERVKWTAEAPQLNAADSKQMYDLLKTYIAACMNRPDSWFGSGAKAYQTESELRGEPTFKDLGSRQRYWKYELEYVLRFVLDQAILSGRLREPDGGFFPEIHMPDVSAKDFQKTVNALSVLSQALMIAETQKWITRETAAKLYAAAASQAGVEIDSAEEMEKIGETSDVTEDYEG